MLRFLLWRLLAVAALLAGYTLLVWFLRGGVGALLRGESSRHAISLGGALTGPFAVAAGDLWRWRPALDVRPMRVALVALLGTVPVLSLTRLLAREADNERVLLHRGRLLKRVGRIREALRDFERVAAVNPRNKEAASEIRALKRAGT